jgi:5-methylcytosine-specific restriction endonuclease McrA
MRLLTLRCQDCGHEFDAKRTDAKRCKLCGTAAYRRQTRESYERHREERIARATVYQRERRESHREEINADLRTKYATDQEYRESRRAHARVWSALHGGSHNSIKKRREYAGKKYVEHKTEGNRKRMERYRANTYRADECAVCGLDDERVLTVHHTIPLSRGGTSEPSNLETLCRNCHAVADWQARGSE